MIARNKFTYKDYVRFPNDGKIHEIIDGAHYNHPASRIKHQRISRNLEFIFVPFIRKNKLGEWFDSPIDVILGPYDIVQPDKLFISKEKEGIITELNIQGVPDLIIEITSPTDPGFDKETKLTLYSRFSVKNYWIVDSQLDVLEVYVHKGVGYELLGKYKKGDKFEPDLFPGLKVNVSEIFE